MFFPTNVQEILDLGIHAFAMSRFSGIWSGMKTIQEIVESSATAMIDPERVDIVIPTDFQMPPGGLHIRWPDHALEQEARLMHYKWYAALAYIRANRLNHNVIEGPNDRFGIMASGKAFNDTRQALIDLGLDDAACRQLGIRLHKVGVVWPLEAQLTREFATGLQEILVVEEKRQVIEYQLKEELYNWRSDVRPNVVGKFDEGEVHAAEGYSGGEWSMPNPTAHTLLRANADLNPALIAKAIAQRLKKTGILAAAGADMAARIDAQLAILEAKERAMDGAAGRRRRRRGAPALVLLGLPAQHQHRGARRLARDGRHRLPLHGDLDGPLDHRLHADGRRGRAVGRPAALHHRPAHLRQPGRRHLLPQRPAGHPPEHRGRRQHHLQDPLQRRGRHDRRPAGRRAARGPFGAADRREPACRRRGEGGHRHRRAREVRGREGAGRRREGRATATTLDEIQREFREITGTTAIIYDQTCATEKRRRRKRGTAVDPAKRVVINELVCEGCGDCSVQSNCLSVEPLETEFGRKRTINQSTCNKDMSCLKGFCPSFVTVEGGQLKKKAKNKAAPSPAELRRAARAGACRRSPPARSGASWWPASAAPASSPSASCSAWRRTSRARASSRRTRPAWRRRAAPPGATC